MPRNNYNKLTESLGHHYYWDNLDENSIVFDCGSYKGLFTLLIALNNGARVYSYEPLYSDSITLYDESIGVINLKDMLIKELDNWKIRDKVFISNKCISNEIHDDVIMYYNTENPKGTSLLRHDNQDLNKSKVSVSTTTIEHEMNANHIDELELLKLDIEGAEINVIHTLSSDILKRINQITVEWHSDKGLQGYSDKLVEYNMQYLVDNGFKHTRFESIGFRPSESLFVRE